MTVTTNEEIHYLTPVEIRDASGVHTRELCYRHRDEAMRTPNARVIVHRGGRVDVCPRCQE